MTNQQTSPSTPPATKTFTVWADATTRVYQKVRATSPQEAYHLAEESPDHWEFCSDAGDNEYVLSPHVMDVETEEFIRVADPLGPTMRQPDVGRGSGTPATPPLHSQGPWNPAILSRGRTGSYSVYADPGDAMSTRIADVVPIGDDERDKANARMMAASLAMREASQHLYNAINDYLRLPDSALPRDLVEAMDEMEAAWRAADGSALEDDHAQAA